MLGRREPCAEGADTEAPNGGLCEGKPLPSGAPAGAGVADETVCDSSPTLNKLSPTHVMLPPRSTSAGTTNICAAWSDVLIFFSKYKGARTCDKLSAVAFDRPEEEEEERWRKARRRAC
jgi:hypothetical protein